MSNIPPKPQPAATQASAAPAQVEVKPQDAFSAQAEAPQPSLAAEFLDFLVHNKAWWLTPIVVVLLLVGVLVLVSGTAAAPFIYTLF